MELNLESSIICISAGYYHSAFVTVDGRLYTCGENDSGKLGLPESTLRKSPLCVHCVPAFDRKVVWVSCGGNHTVVVLADGTVYSCGNGLDGQLGLGLQLLSTPTPHQIISLEHIKIARVSCGENHTAFISDKGQLYVCGNGRHGKLCLLEVDDSSNQFVPTLVTRFNGFQVQHVACGGCHTMVLAMKKKEVDSFPYANINQPNESLSARERRRQKQSKTTAASKGDTFSPTLKAEYRQRLTSISKGSIWYVSLADALSHSSDEDVDEVITKTDSSLLSQIEKDHSIRHVDSDVDSDSSEGIDLDKTHTLVRIDNTILIRPIVEGQCETGGNGESGFAQKELPSALKCEDVHNSNLNICDKEVNLENLSSENLNQSSKIPSVKKPEMKSQFYDMVDDIDNKNLNSSSQSIDSKTSSACIII